MTVSQSIANGPGLEAGGSGDIPLRLLLACNLLLFAGGATAHSGLAINFGFATWEEPVLIPAAIIEGLGALGLAIALIARLTNNPRTDRITSIVLWYCFAGVLWGMARLAMGSIPEARTETNDFLHIGMTLLNTLSLVRLTSLRREHVTPSRF